MNEREYDRIQNEGGEGYNPIRAARQEREIMEDSAHVMTVEEIIDSLIRKSNAIDISVNAPAGNIAKYENIRAEIANLRGKLDADFLASWTLDTTTSRRATWNAKVKSGAFGKMGSGRVDFRAVADAESEQGWTLTNLKKAIKLHNL